MTTTLPLNINQLAGEALNAVSLNADIGRPADSAWVRQAFIVATTDTSAGKKSLLLDPVDTANRDYSSAYLKYTDSTVGGNFCINPPPQFTPYCDPPVKGLSKLAIDQGIDYQAGITGMGQYYSEAIDDNNHIVHLTFGFPAYNSLWQFFTGFYNDGLATLARTGRTTTGILDSLMKLAFNVINIAILPLTIMPILFMMTGNAIRFFLKMPASKFYYFKDGMPIYWQVVNNLVNQLAVNKRLVTYTQPAIYESFMEEKPRLDNAKKTIFHQIFPEMAADGIIDVYAIANRAKRLEARHRKEVYRQMLQGGDSGWYGKVRKVISEGGGLEQVDAMETKPWSQKTFLEKWFLNREMSDGEGKLGAIETEIRVAPDSLAAATGQEALDKLQTEKYTPTVKDKFIDYFLSSVADGSRYASFRVSNVDPITESYSNATGPSALAEQLNQKSQQARELRVSYAEGNVDPMGVVQGILSGAKAVLTNTLDMVHLGGMASFAGRAFVDIPEHWTSHTANTGTDQSYKISLVTPYNNEISQMLYIYIPLCMLMAGTMPLATGKQSYGSPFICQLYDRGRSITRLGIISSLSITRGTTNLAWHKDGNPLGVDVTFTVKDLSSVTALPVHEGFSTMPLDGLFDTENKFSDLMMVYANLSLQEVTDPIPILKRQLDMKWADIQQYVSPSRIAMQLSGTMPGQILSAFMSGTDKK